MVATATLLASPGQQASAAPAPASSEEKFDGGELVIGLLFGLGPVGKRYPELAMARVEETEATLKVAAEFVADISRSDPGLLDEFAAAMYSGNHVRISDAIKDLDERMKTLAPAPEPGAVPNSMPIDYLLDSSLDLSRTIDLSTVDVRDLSVSFYQYVWIAVNAVLAAFIAYALNIGVIIAAIIAWYREPGGGDELTFERWVDRVATTLGTR
jgi:SdpC family antimicrobial peptide